MAAKNIKTIKILGIDTSCDDTSIALVKIQDTRYKILSNVVSSQVKLHAKYGGVFPSLAKREHQKNLPAVLNEALRFASLSQSKPKKFRFTGFFCSMKISRIVIDI